MALTEMQIKVISECPLDDTFNHLRDKLHADDPRPGDIFELLRALLLSHAAFHLPSPDGSYNVVDKLLSIQHLISSNRNVVKLDEFGPLVRHVSDNSPDAIIWAEIFNLINVLGSLAPSTPSFGPRSRETPIMTSLRRDSDSEARDIVQPGPFRDVKNCTFRSVGKFWDKFFNPRNEAQKAMLEGIMTAHDGRRWVDFPATPDKEPVWNWLRSLEKHLADAPCKLYTTKVAHQFQGRKGQMNLFFLQRPATAASKPIHYKEVLVVGRQKKSHDTFKADFLQLVRHVQNVFADQPTRRFVHAFSLYASEMELWVFDRSGAYSSGPFDIHDEPDKFARAFVGYSTMDNNAIGLDTFIEREDDHHYVTLYNAAGETTRLRLDAPMIRQRAIVSRGTTCFRTDNHVAKFSWIPGKRELEVEHLKLAEKRGVKGVVRVIAHRQITTIAEMREGLDFSKPYEFWDDDAYSCNALLATSSGNKRKSVSHTSDNASRLRVDSPKAQPDKKYIDHSHTPREGLWANRIYSCLVISPAGRVISDFRTTKELLESMRDAIKAHRSLYTIGNILHRDISPNNIIITKPEMADGFKGMLIDLDLAKVGDNGPSKAQQIGTLQFMAIEVLEMTDHTYRHDLESFFYVLIWMCALQSRSNGFGKESRPEWSLLQQWEVGSCTDIARVKIGDIIRLSRILDEFPESLNSVKPLCRKIKEILFTDEISFGTPSGDADQLYIPIIDAYDTVIRGL